MYPSSCDANYTTYSTCYFVSSLLEKSIFSYNDARSAIASMHQEDKQLKRWKQKKINTRVVHKKIQKGFPVES